MKETVFFILLITVFISCEGKTEKFILNSPDGEINLRISLVDSILNYQLNWSGQEMIGKSELEIFPDSKVNILDYRQEEYDGFWKPVWEQFSSIRDNYNQLELDIKCNEVKGKLLARVYNQGVAFRFMLDKGAKPNGAFFHCSYKLPEGSTYYSPVHENEPIGPLTLAELNDWTQSKNGTQQNINVPLVVETPGNSFLALLESDLYAATGFESMKLNVNLPEGQITSGNTVALGKEELMTPWRVILLGLSAGDLVTNTVLVNLASPCKLKNTDWIKPGKALWDWRVYGYTAPDGFVYGINTESYKRIIDFAANSGIEYFLIDDSWYTKVTNGHFEVNEKLDLPSVIGYAKRKNVGIILYYDRRKGEYGDKVLFPNFQSIGAKGIKYGFMGNNIPFTKDAIRLSAESKLLIDFHDGPVPFSGIHRTYPNAVSREYCHAQQDSRRAFTPETFIKMALINAITGPLDMNNGNFDLTGINAGLRQKGPLKPNSYFSTVTAEAARTLIIFSGLVVIPDTPDAYEAKKDLFEFIQKQPVGKWDESRILNSKIGEYITTARRHGKEWFIGSVHNINGGTLNINLDFLDENMEYDVTFYEDTDQTHCKTNPETYRIRAGKVRKGDIVKAILAPGGGHCMWIRPKTEI